MPGCKLKKIAQLQNMYHWWTYRLTVSVPARKISKDHYFGSPAYLSNKTYGSLIIYKKLQSILPGVSIHFHAQNPVDSPVFPSPEHRSPPSKDQPRGIEANLGGWATRKDQEHPTENGSQPENHLQSLAWRSPPPPTIPKHHRHWTQQQQAPTAQGSSNGGYQQLQAHTLMTNIIILVSIAMIHCNSRYLSNNFLERNKACQFFVTFLGWLSDPFKGLVTS